MVGFRAWTRLVRLTTYAVLVLLSALFLLPLLWMLSASLKSEVGVHEYPPALIPTEAVIQERNGQKLRVARYRAAPGEPARPALILDEQPGEYLLEVTGDGGGTEQITVPRPSVEVVRVLRPRWSNYPEAWTAEPFSRFTLNSLIITVACIFGQVLS
jgi:alpha-1,4-digalacturonate transport system permease protein